jgi:hypothetical protein
VKFVKTSSAMDRVIISIFDKRILGRNAEMDTPPAVACISDLWADKSVLKMLFAIKAISWHSRFEVLTRDQVCLMHTGSLPGRCITAVRVIIR